MSYCVNCGVELDNSEKQCPLCQTEIINPRNEQKEGSARPYPSSLEHIAKRIDHRFFAALTSVIMLIPMLTTLLLDLLDGNGVSWSGYVWGALTMLFVWLILPFFFRRRHDLLFLAADCLAVALYLFLIETFSDGSWFLTLGLPITAAATICIIGTASIFIYGKRTGNLRKSAWVFAVIGIFCLAVDFLVGLNITGTVHFKWSLFVLIPCLALSACALILERRKNLREEIRRRLFF